MAIEPRLLLNDMFMAAIDAALPSSRIPLFMPRAPKGRTIVIGAGKASAAMARAFEDKWHGPVEGLVVTRYGHSVPCKRIEIVEAAHPVPDENGQRAAERMLAMLKGLTSDDLVVALISGGGSALLALPAPGLTFADKQEINRALLNCGAPIDEMNCVRKHLSAIKGGRLAAAAHPAKVVTLAISDVPGDDPQIIASGPTLPDSTSFADARAILAKYGIKSPASVMAHLRLAQDETPKPGSKGFANDEISVIASPQLSLEVAADLGRRAGLNVVILGDSLEGEAKDMGFVLAGIAKQVQSKQQPAPPPCVLLSGGESTVTVRGAGKGGRNVEFLLALALKLQGQPGIHALAGDTDGIDGAEDVAGAIIGPETLAAARKAGIDPWAALADNDAHSLFRAVKSQVITGPTLTNVNDFRAIIIEPVERS